MIAKVLKDLYICIRVYKHHDLILLVEVSAWSYFWVHHRLSIQHNFNLHKLLNHSIKIPPTTPPWTTDGGSILLFCQRVNSPQTYNLHVFVVNLCVRILKKMTISNLHFFIAQSWPQGCSSKICIKGYWWYIKHSLAGLGKAIDQAGIWRNDKEQGILIY